MGAEHRLRLSSPDTQQQAMATTTSSDLESARARVAAAYDPRTFAAAGEKVITTLADHLRRVEARDAAALNWNEPAALVRDAEQSLAGGGKSTDVPARIQELASQALARGQNLHHPHYVGHQVPASVPLAALFDLLGSVTNQGMAIFEMGPFATAVEHAVVAAVGEQLGFAPGTFTGLVTSGGSLANLTALLTARNVALGESWTAGIVNQGPAPVIVAHADIHYSVTRSAGILGLGTDNIRVAALDADRRMDANRLDDQLRELRSRGGPIVAVASAACATPIGAFDRLREIADVCRRHEVWLHVDAAHGGAAAFSATHRHLVDGLAEADSVICDAHKMLFVPALAAMVFYRDRAHRFTAFEQQAPYLYDPIATTLADYDSGLVTIECTKRAAAFGLWGIWSTFGPQIFSDMVDVTFDLAQKLHALLSAADDFETLHVPECNIVAFRHLPAQLRDAAPDEIDLFQLRLRRSVIESGEYYLVQSNLDGRNVLRTTIMNPLTTADDLRGLLECLRRHGALLLREGEAPAEL
ncbi:MAG: aspartate aminotransferase family protein [Pirellulales bacterium]